MIDTNRYLLQFRNLHKNHTIDTIDTIDTIQEENTKIHAINLHQCTVCKEETITIDNGARICTTCGTDYGNDLDHKSEWNSYGVGQNLQRCSGTFNPLLIESSYGTSIGYVGYNQTFKRIKTLNSWKAMPPHERSLKNVFDKLTSDAQAYGLTKNIIQYSHILFAEIVKMHAKFGKTKLSRASMRNGLIAACLYYACKEYDVARSHHEIGEICNVDSSYVTRGIKLFHRLMKNSILINMNQDTSRYITKSSDFLNRYCNRLNIDKGVSDDIFQIAKKIRELNILIKNTPQSIACGCIYYCSVAFALNINKQEIVDKCEISISTITKTYDKLIKHTNKLL